MNPLPIAKESAGTQVMVLPNWRNKSSIPTTGAARFSVIPGAPFQRKLTSTFIGNPSILLLS